MRGPHGMLAAFQHTVLLGDMVAKLSAALAAAGHPAQPIDAAYRSAAQQLRSREAQMPLLCCMALDTPAGGQPAVACAAHSEAPRLAIQFALHA